MNRTFQVAGICSQCLYQCENQVNVEITGRRESKEAKKLGNQIRTRVTRTSKEPM